MAQKTTTLENNWFQLTLKTVTEGGGKLPRRALLSRELSLRKSPI